MAKEKLLMSAILCLALAGAKAQVEVRTEAQVSAAIGSHNPLWLNANKYGLSSIERLNGYLRAGAFRQQKADSTKTWDWSAGIDMAVTQGFTSRIVLQQAYGELRWHKAQLTIGSKQQPMELRNQELSSGTQTLGINARPLPMVRLSLPQYVDIPGTRGLLAVKGHIAYGIQTDDAWQKDFTQQQSKYTERSKLHTKAGYLRIGRQDKPFNVELGIEMACQFGGTSYQYGLQGGPTENEDGLKGMVHALIPSGGEAVETVYRNADGNHLGSWVLRANLDYERWGISVYADHFFEDQSSMFFLDYDGYGSGEQWNEKQQSRYFLYDLKDIMLGMELRLADNPFLNAFVLEYLYTKYQCGPIYHDHTQSISDHVCGIDNYYNHALQPGWQHWGQVMGNPLYRSPIYNDDNQITVENNRFWAWHFALSGNPIGLHYRFLCSLQEGLGTYHHPYTNPEMNLSMMLEVGRQFPATSPLAGWSVKGAVGMDAGDLLGHSLGLQFTIAKTLKR